MKARGRWHGKRCYFGFHHDLHLDERDRGAGTRCTPKELAPMLRLTGADWVQTDSKGHPGYTSWFSQIPGASVAPGLVKDALQQWRAATRELGLPLHAHYSGLWDTAAALKHPEWCVVLADGSAGTAGFMGIEHPTSGRRCPRGPYLDELMIPQLLEMIDRYDIDGFWVDGDIWAALPCYCPRCREAFTAATGIAEPPTEPSDAHWPAWWNFTRESFEAYVTRYTEAVHQHKPGVLVCSNSLQTLHDPGEPRVPTDWISLDNVPVWGLDTTRCEARFISTRGKPWDIMMWAFYFSRGGLGEAEWAPAMKPVQMLQQEAAVIVACGGNVQTCENPFGLRTGQLVPWRMKRIGELARFVKRRRALCQDTETLPQIVVLHSEHHLRALPTTDNLKYGVDVTPVQGAVFSLLECQYGVDIMDEWALLPRLAEFPVVVAPEQDRMSDEMVAALKAYVQAGGKLLVTGARSWERFGAEFLGVSRGKVVEEAIYHVPAADGTVPIFSAAWRLVKPTTAKVLGWLGKTPLPDEQLLPHPAATIHRVGKGAAVYVPGSVFGDYASNRYPLTRDFVGAILRALAGRLDVEVQAPACVDVILRRKGARTLVHLINRNSGLPSLPHSAVVDEIAPVGPVTVKVRRPDAPKTVKLAFEQASLEWKYVKGTLTVKVPSVEIHAAVVVE